MLVSRVLFVCLGNICRSPTAEGMFRKTVHSRGLDRQFEIDSAGTGDWHIGAPPDHRAQRAAARRGIDLSGLRARQADAADMARFDYIIAMDRDNHTSPDMPGRRAIPAQGSPVSRPEPGHRPG